MIGSNIGNIALILGVSALIAPLAVHANIIRVDIPILIAVSVLVVLVCLDGGLARWDGLGLSAGLLAYIVFSVIMARRERSRELAAEFGAEVPKPTGSLGADLGLVAGGLVLLVLGARWLVAGAVFIAEDFGVSQAVIGLTLVALGTSLPELATSVVAALRRHTDLAVGNIIGSNIFNLLGILGVSSALVPYEVTGIRLVDWLAMVGVAVILLPLVMPYSTITRGKGALLVLLYGAYIAYLVLRGA